MSTSDSNENSGASTSDPVKDTSQIMLTASLPHEGAHQDPHPHSGGKPIVYSALLSGVAEQFRSMITLSEKVKDGVTYQDAFDGQEAVDKLALIIRTKDRNLAVVVGRTLDAQNFLHDVTYSHRLRDSPNEIYQFTSRLPSSSVSEEVVLPRGTSELSKPLPASSPQQSNITAGTTTKSSLSAFTSSLRSVLTRTSPAPNAQKSSVSPADDVPPPVGLFTLLTDCYSPTCTRDVLGYSITCPRRMEQRRRLGMKLEFLSPYLYNSPVGETATPLIDSVPAEIAASVSEEK